MSDHVSDLWSDKNVLYSAWVCERARSCVVLFCSHALTVGIPVAFNECVL